MSFLTGPLAAAASGRAGASGECDHCGELGKERDFWKNQARQLLEENTKQQSRFEQEIKQLKAQLQPKTATDGKKDGDYDPRAANEALRVQQLEGLKTQVLQFCKDNKGKSKMTFPLSKSKHLSSWQLSRQDAVLRSFVHWMIDTKHWAVDFVVSSVGADSCMELDINVEPVVLLRHAGERIHKSTDSSWSYCETFDPGCDPSFR